MIFTRSNMLPLEKKTNTNKCEEHRTIYFIYTLRKYHTRHFVTGCIVARHIEKAINHCKDEFVPFVDYEKAFDRVHWPKLMQVLSKIGVDYETEKLFGIST